jgi:hypothetical protein
MESKDLFILLIVAGLAILLYAYWHFIGSKKEIKDSASDTERGREKENLDNSQKCEGDFCARSSY